MDLKMEPLDERIAIRNRNGGRKRYDSETGRGDRPTAPIHTSKFRFNVTLRDGQADGSPVDTIPPRKESQDEVFLKSNVNNSEASVKH
jgi:hypothetical protein